MCVTQTNPVLERNDTRNTSDTLVERNNIVHTEKNTPHHNKPLTTPTSLTCASKTSQLDPKHVTSEQNEKASRFIRHLLESLLAVATSTRPRPSDDYEALPNSTNAHRSSPIIEANQTPTRASAASSSDSDSSASYLDDGANVLPTACEDDDADHRRDASLKTKHEKDENKIYISRPEFVATEQHTLVKVGTISGILDSAVIVTTLNLADIQLRLPNADITTATALDTGSLLCFPDGTLLGAVFETFGPVTSPLYVVRFNNSDEIPSATKVGQEIMYVEQEMSVVRARDVCWKGYDASGKDDEEVDAEEFSDDEKERCAKKLKRSGTNDRTAGPLKRKRRPRERQRQRRPERPPLRTNHEFHRSTLVGFGENEPRRYGRNPYHLTQPSVRRFEADAHSSLQAHANIHTYAPASQSHFITGGAPYIPPHYAAEVPVSVPPTANLSGSHESSYHGQGTNALHPISFHPSPFTAPIAPFSEHTMPVSRETTSYTQSWGAHANYDQYGSNRHPNTVQQSYHHVGHPMPSYAVGPSHPYHRQEHHPYEAVDRASYPQHQNVTPNLSMDAQSWQGVPRQHDHM